MFVKMLVFGVTDFGILLRMLVLGSWVFFKIWVFGSVIMVFFQAIGLGVSSALGQAGIIEFNFDSYLEAEDAMRDYLAADTIIQYFDLIGIFLLLWILMRFVDKEPFINLGFSIKGKTNDIILGMTLGLLLMAVGYSILILLGEIKFVSFNYDLKSILLLFLLFVAVSVVEETYVRGYVLKNLLKSFNPVVSLIISSAIFSLLCAKIRQNFDETCSEFHKI